MVQVLDALRRQETAVRPKLRMTHLQCNGDAPAVGAYARYLADLLGGDLEQRRLEPANRQEMIAQASEAAAESDLLLFGEPAPCLLGRLLNLRGDRRLVDRVGAPILVARQPSWPLRTILLVVRAEESDKTAVEWTRRLAMASRAEVTVLAVTPHARAMYALGNPQVGVDVLLAPNTPSGIRLRSDLRQLADSDVVCELHLRQGEPDWQIRWEMEAADHDLIVIADETYGRLARWALGDLVTPLLRWAQRPLLVTKPGAGGGDA